MKWLLLTVLFSTLVNAIDSEKKSLKQTNGRIHAKKPNLSINACDRKIISLTAQLYEEVLLLRAEVKELQRQLRAQSSNKRVKTDGELFVEDWIA